VSVCVQPPQNPSPPKENAPHGGFERGRVAEPSTTHVREYRGAADPEGMEGHVERVAPAPGLSGKDGPFRQKG